VAGRAVVVLQGGLETRYDYKREATIQLEDKASGSDKRGQIISRKKEWQDQRMDVEQDYMVDESGAVA
jgi:hypothetical protein